MTLQHCLQHSSMILVTCGIVLYECIGRYCMHELKMTSDPTAITQHLQLSCFINHSVENALHLGNHLESALPTTHWWREVKNCRRS